MTASNQRAYSILEKCCQSDMKGFGDYSKVVSQWLKGPGLEDLAGVLTKHEFGSSDTSITCKTGKTHISGAQSNLLKCNQVTGVKLRTWQTL